MTIGERIRIIRKTLKLTQGEFGKQLHIGTSTVCVLEKGMARVTERTLRGICNEYDVNYHWLTTGEGGMFDHSESHGYLSDELADTIKKYPSLYETAKLVAPHMSGSDWSKVNILFDGLGGY